MADDFKPDYMNLHFDLVNTIANLKLAERELKLAGIYISVTTEKEKPLEIDAIARASLSTGITLTTGMVARLITMAEAARVPCEHRYPELADHSGRIQ